MTEYQTAARFEWQRALFVDSDFNTVNVGYDTPAPSPLLKSEHEKAGTVT